MAVDITELAEWCGADPLDPVLTRVLAVAESLVADHLKGSGRCPEVVREQAVTQLASELWTRRNAPGGIASWGPDGSAPMRLARDAMVSVLPLLAPFRRLPAVG